MAKIPEDNFTSKIEVNFTDAQWEAYIRNCVMGAAELIEIISSEELDEFERELYSRSKAE